jgi:hypothetical protein
MRAHVLVTVLLHHQAISLFLAFLLLLGSLRLLKQLPILLQYLVHHVRLQIQNIWELYS